VKAKTFGKTLTCVEAEAPVKIEGDAVEGVEAYTVVGG